MLPTIKKQSIFFELEIDIEWVIFVAHAYTGFNPVGNFCQTRYHKKEKDFVNISIGLSPYIVIINK